MKSSTQSVSWRASEHEHRRRSHALPSPRRLLQLFIMILAVGALSAACGGDDESVGTAGEAEPADAEQGDTAGGFEGTLAIGAIPDQDPEVLARLYGLVTDHLEAELPGVTVDYVPVTDYQGAVSGFAVADLDIVWFGGLTGVQARLEVDGAQAIAQRDIDAEFTSVFIANTAAGIEPIADVGGLAALEGHSLTFGSDSSTSGRLMPQSFLSEAGLDIESSFTGEVGFSGSHDATIELVAAGTYEVGALNSQVWDSRVEEGVVDAATVVEVFRTPPYFDYHWVAQPDLDERFGEGFTDAFVAALMSLDAADPDDAAILELFGAASFVTTENENYAAIEAVARDIGAIR